MAITSQKRYDPKLIVSLLTERRIRRQQDPKPIVTNLRLQKAYDQDFFYMYLKKRQIPEELLRTDEVEDKSKLLGSRRLKFPTKL